MAQSHLTRVEFLSRHLQGPGGWCWGQGPWLPGSIWFPAASLHGALGIWNYLLSPIQGSLGAWESELLFGLCCDLGGSGERGWVPKYEA